MKLLEEIKWLLFLEKAIVWGSDYAFSITSDKLLKFIFSAAIFQLLWQNML